MVLQINAPEVLTILWSSLFFHSPWHQKSYSPSVVRGDVPISLTVPSGVSRVKPLDIQSYLLRFGVWMSRVYWRQEAHLKVKLLPGGAWVNCFRYRVNMKVFHIIDVKLKKNTYRDDSNSLFPQMAEVHVPDLTKGWFPYKPLTKRGCSRWTPCKWIHDLPWHEPEVLTFTQEVSADLNGGFPLVGSGILYLDHPKDQQLCLVGLPGVTPLKQHFSKPKHGPFCSPLRGNGHVKDPNSECWMHIKQAWKRWRVLLPLSSSDQSVSNIF